MLYFDCPKCGAHLRAPDEAAGTDGRCPCGAEFPLKRTIDLEPASGPLPNRLKTALVPSILATCFGAVAFVTFAFSREARRDQKERLDQMENSGEWLREPRAAASEFPTELDCVWIIAAIVAVSMLAVAVLRSGLAARD